jgi:hypothetical protein
MTAEDYGLARRMWHQLEPVHAVFWYAPEVFAEAAALGYEVKTRWPSYFAWRLAPLGGGSAAEILAARERAVNRMYRAPDQPRPLAGA